MIVASGLGDAERIADDKDNGLALLRVYGPRKLSPLALAHERAKAGDLTLVGIPDPKEQDGSRKLTEIKARLADGSGDRTAPAGADGRIFRRRRARRPGPVSSA